MNAPARAFSVSPQPSPWPGRLAWLVLLAGVLVRAPYVIMPVQDADMAMWGVQALDIMHGHPHFLFSGELFGGSLEAWLAVPLFWLLGAGPEILSLVPTSLSLVMVWMVWRLGRQELGGWGGLAAMLWAAVGPYYFIQQCVEPKGGYIEVPLFTVLAFALTLRLLRTLANPAERPGLTSLALGLVWGLGTWCHLLMVPTVAACGLFLLLHQPRILASRHLPLMALGFVLGSLPLWVISLPAGLLAQDVLGEGRQMQLGPAWRALWREGLPQALGLPPAAYLPKRQLWDSLRACIYLGYGLALLLPLWAWRKRLFSRQGGPGALLRLCLLFVVVYLAAWLFSGAYSQSTWRHLSPLYAALPFLFGALAAIASQSLRPLAIFLVLLAVGLHLMGAWQMTPLFRQEAWSIHQEKRHQDQRLFAWLKERGYRHVYSQWFWDALPLTLAAQGEITFADQLENHLPSLTRLADASTRPAYVFTTRAKDFETSLDLAGIAYRRTVMGRFTVLDNFSRPERPLRRLDSAKWSSPLAGAADAWDGNLSTRWTTAGPQTVGQSFVLDLGEVCQGLCRLVIMPGNINDAPRGLDVLLSEDGQNWKRAARQKGGIFPLFWSLDRPLMRVLSARMEVSFPPQAARYLQLVQIDQTKDWWWSIAELALYQAIPGPGQPAPTQAAPGKTAQVQAAPPQTAPATPAALASQAALSLEQGLVYADPPLTALLPPERAGLETPQRPPSQGLPYKTLDIQERPANLLCVAQADWPASRALLELYAGGPVKATPLGPYMLVQGLEPAQESFRHVRPPQGTGIYTSDEALDPTLVLEGSSLVRWRAPSPQQAGQSVRLDFGQELLLAGLVMGAQNWPGDHPRGLRVEISLDGRTWRTPLDLSIRLGRLIWGGNQVLLRDGPFRITFHPSPARQVRLTLTQSHPRQHWTISHLRLLEPEPPPKP